MSLRRKVEEKIKKKEEEIREYEAKVRESRAYIQGLQDTLRLMPKEGQEHIAPEDKLKRGSSPHSTYMLLKENGSPMHVSDIVKGIGKQVTKSSKIALSGTIGMYARKNDIFVRTGPNIFGLVEWQSKSGNEPPSDFGLPEDSE